MNNVKKIFLVIIIFAYVSSKAGLQEAMKDAFPGVGVAVVREVDNVLTKHTPMINKLKENYEL